MSHEGQLYLMKVKKKKKCKNTILSVKKKKKNKFY